MTTVDLAIAQQYLQQLTDEAAHGHDVIIIRPDGSAFKLVPLVTGSPVFGSAAGKIIIRDDFDAPLGQLPTAKARGLAPHSNGVDTIGWLTTARSILIAAL